MKQNYKVLSMRQNRRGSTPHHRQTTTSNKDNYRPCNRARSTTQGLANRCLGLLFVVLFLSFQPMAIGQTVLDNTSVTSAGSLSVGDNISLGSPPPYSKVAQNFTTGTALTAEAISVTLVMDNENGGTFNHDFVVQIWGESGGNPDDGNVLATLSGNSDPSTAGTYTYTGTVTWTAGQNLFIVCSANESGSFVPTGSAYRWVLTASSTITTSNGYTSNQHTHIQLFDGAPWSSSNTNRQFFSLSIPSLPVELTTFGAQPRAGTVLLDWQTASEQNNAGFDIERSSNGEAFEKIGYVTGKGTTPEVSNYDFIDENPINGINYYRLKQMDSDGQFEYSKVVTVALTSEDKEVAIFPNPVKSTLNIVNGQGTITIYNALGQQVRQLTNTEAQLMLDMNDLPKGIYTLHIQNTNGQFTAKQFVK